MPCTEERITNARLEPDLNSIQTQGYVYTLDAGQMRVFWYENHHQTLFRTKSCVYTFWMRFCWCDSSHIFSSEQNHMYIPCMPSGWECAGEIMMRIVFVQHSHTDRMQGIYIFLCPNQLDTVTCIYLSRWLIRMRICFYGNRYHILIRTQF